MRAEEFLQEDYSQKLESDLENLLVGAIGAGAAEISTEKLLDQLNKMGYSVDMNSVMMLLSGSPVVMNATPTIIKFVSNDQTSKSSGNTGNSAQRVSDMAQKATQIS